MKNDKKKMTKNKFISIKKIGKTTLPGKFKYSTKQIESMIKKLF